MENIRINRAMGELGTALFPDGARAHIFCNVGALATGLDDRVFGVFRLEVEAGKKISVIADEVRPFYKCKFSCLDIIQKKYPLQQFLLVWPAIL